MKYYAMRKLKVNGENVGFAQPIENFEQLPPRNQQSMIDLGWVKAVADSEREPTPGKSKTTMSTRKKTTRKKKDESSVKEGD